MRRRTSSGRRLALTTVAFGAALALAGCTAGTGSTGGTGGTDEAERTEAPSSAPSARPTSPLPGADLWVNPYSSASWAVDELRDAGDDQGAEAIARLAEVPTATWMGGETDTRVKATQLTTDAQKAGDVPVLVAYNLPERDCGQYSRGGAGSPEQYLGWTRELVAGIGDRPAVVVLEPDAIAHAIVGCDGGQMATERYALLSEAVDLYAESPNVGLYIDAGNASWVPDTAKVADALRDSGIDRAAGFSLNVSNFEPTEVSTRYGKEVSSLLGGDVPFVVDTSRNGADVEDGDWCNPSAARLGEEPTAQTDDTLVHGLLWVKVPGDSDGTCKAGAPPAGLWWQSFADSLIS